MPWAVLENCPCAVRTRQGFLEPWREQAMADKTELYAVRYPDGSVSLYVDEEYAIERGVDPTTLVCVDIPSELYIKGTIQDIREYVATYLESRLASQEGHSA